MRYLVIALVAFLSVISGLRVPSFAPPKFPVSTIDNDGVSCTQIFECPPL
jgi:hypothetical protein